MEYPTHLSSKRQQQQNNININDVVIIHHLNLPYTYTKKRNHRVVYELTSHWLVIYPCIVTLAYLRILFRNLLLSKVMDRVTISAVPSGRPESANVKLRRPKFICEVNLFGFFLRK